MNFSIRTCLLILVAALSLPLAGALGYAIYSDRQNTITETRAALRTLATVVAANTARQMDIIRKTLEQLALRPQVRALDPNHCDGLLKELQSLYPDYANIISADLRGDVVCAALPTTPGGVANVAELPGYRKLMDEKRFIVGAPHPDRSTGQPLAWLGVPIWNQRGELVGTVHLAIHLPAFNPQMPADRLPAENRHGLFHENGFMMWRNVDIERLIGTRPNTDAARSIVAVRDGEFESVAADGVTRFFSVLPVHGTGLIAYVAVPIDKLNEGLRTRTLVSVLLGLLGLVILLLQARTISRRIERPIASIVETARAVRAGQLDARAKPSGPTELVAVADEFNAMIDAHLTGERELRASEERLNAFLDNSAVIAWLKDEEDRFVFVSKNFLTRFRLEAGDILGKTAEQIWPPDIARNFDLGEPSVVAEAAGAPAMSSAARIARCNQGHAFETIERATNPDGGLSWWLSNKFAFRDTAGNRLAGALAVDISERERAREELLESGKLSEQIFSSAQEGIVVYAHDLHYRLWNPYMERFTGMRADQVIGRHPLEVFPFLQESGVMDKLHAAMEGEIAEPVEFHFTVEQTGISGWATDRTAPLFNARGEVIGVITTVSDVTQRVEAERRLRELNETLEARVVQRTEALDAARQDAERLSRIKSEFLANMSHEIRTPLNGVLGMAQLGYRNSEGNPSVQHTFELIISSGMLLLGVINDVLDFSKIEAGKLHIDALPTDPGQAIDHALALLSNVARSKQIELKVERSADFPAACLIDGLRLEQVLVNLLSNAVKFTEAGAVSLLAARDGEQLRFRISDTGVGMDAEQISRLFRPFEQADSSTTRRFGGTGLGLAIVDRIVSLMGGTISVSSLPGSGSTFDVRLPLREIDRAALGGSSRRRASIGHAGRRLDGMRILVAEDNELNQIVIEGLLKAEGAGLTLAGDGRQAVEQVTRQGGTAFDLVLMDIQMPMMNGYEAARRILALSPKLPIVALTAHALAEERNLCLDAGMIDQATKPIDAESLVAVILRATGRTWNAGLPPDDPPPALVAPATPPTTQPGRIDWDALAATYEQTPAMVPRLLESFTHSSAGRPDAIRAAAQAGDLQQINVHAHGLKSAFGFLKAEASMALAREVERAAKEGHDDALTLAEQLADEVAAVVLEIAGRRR